MKTLLVLAQHPQLADAIRAGLSPEQYRVVQRLDVQEAEPLINNSLVDACILDVDQSHVQALWTVEKIRRRLPQCPLIVFTASKQWEWEEEAYLQGVAHILTKPPRARLLNALVERLWTRAEKPSPPPAAPARQTEFLSRAQAQSNSNQSSKQQGIQALEVLRDFSSILTHSLCAEAMLKQFLLLLREIIGVNRSAIFLRQPYSFFGGANSAQDSRRLRSACALGLAPGLLEHFELSFEAGIGGYLFRQGRILRKDSEVAQEFEIQKEFELLGAQVAIPILDRETLVGVATFDGRVTGEPLESSELGLVFHMLEQLGLAVKNIWLHDQLSANHEMMVDVLRQLSSACVVVSRDLAILSANKTARNYFAGRGRKAGDFEFSDLPQTLGSKVYQVLKTGTGLANFKYQPEDAPNKTYQVSIVPFQSQNSALPNSALLMVEDQTQSEHLQRLEIEAANLRLVKTMAERLSHEIGNALVPLSTHQQLMADRYDDKEFRASLETALADGVKRVSRLINQMRFLASDSLVQRESFPLGGLIEEAYREAQKHYPAKTCQLDLDAETRAAMLAGDRVALKHALSEVFINALQANPSNPRIAIRLKNEAGNNGSSNGHGGMQIEVQDNGPGFTEDAARKVTEPFFTTRNVGLGLGMTVSRKIIENHRGKLSIVQSRPGESGVVRISLPADLSILPGEDQ